MTNTNYFSGIVKILEIPEEYNFNDKMQLTQFRVEIGQKRRSNFALLLIWGKQGREIKTFYKTNDYILIEGYSSIHSPLAQNLQFSNLVQTFITVVKIYPILLTQPINYTKIK